MMVGTHVWRRCEWARPDASDSRARIPMRRLIGNAAVFVRAFPTYEQPFFSG